MRPSREDLRLELGRYCARHDGRRMRQAPPVFSTHVATTRQLFVKSFNVLVHWLSSLIEPPLAGEPDPTVLLHAAGPAADLTGLRRGDADPPISDELIAYSLCGATVQSARRAT